MRYSVQRFFWDAKRFGITLSKLQLRFAPRELPRITVISVPKSGTHLIERILCLHPYLYRRFLPTLHPNNVNRFGGVKYILETTKPGQILITHLHYSEENNKTMDYFKVKKIFVIRDPRDIVVSEAFYMKKNKKHPYHLFAKKLSLEECLYRAIVGDSNQGYPSINETLNWFSGWFHSGSFIVRFEDVINEEKRVDILLELFEYLGIELQATLLKEICEQAVSPVSPTFRKGKSGIWQEYLNDKMYELFLKQAGQWMDVYGYDILSI